MRQSQWQSWTWEEIHAAETPDQCILLPLFGVRGGALDLPF
jgi:hypothetical protein